MTTEQKKKNPDYSNTAVLLYNHKLVEEALTKYHIAQAEADRLRLELEATPLYQQWYAASQVAKEAKANVKEAKANVKEAIQKYGSYQDVEAGHYAVMQAKHVREYHAQPFIDNFPQFTSVVIEPSINVNVLEGLIKGKLLEEKALFNAGVITTKSSYAFIIR